MFCNRLAIGRASFFDSGNCHLIGISDKRMISKDFALKLTDPKPISGL